METEPQQVMSNIKKIAVGDNFTMALDFDGAVWTWGVNNYGQLGLGLATNVKVNEPTKIQSLIDSHLVITDISAGGYGVDEFALALSETMDVYAWGKNYSRQVVNQNVNYYLAPVYTGIARAVSISANREATSYALTETGKVFVWGSNSFMEHGTADLAASSVAKSQTSINDKVVAISTGYRSAFAITENKETYVWGKGVDSQLGVINSDGMPMKNSDIENAMRISGAKTTFAIKAGTKELLATGSNSYSMLGVGSANSSESAFQTVKSDETEDFTNSIWADASNSGYHSMAIRSNGDVYAWGYNGNGQLGNGTFSNSAYPTTVGTQQIRIDGIVNNKLLTYVGATPRTFVPEIITGFNVFEENVSIAGKFRYVSTNENVVTVSEDNQHVLNFVGVGEATVVVAEEETGLYSVIRVQVLPESYADEVQDETAVFPQVYAGHEYSVALKADGTVWTWGRNENGQLGINDQNIGYSGSPVQVKHENGDILADVVDIAAGSYTVYALTRDGYVWTWGRNEYSSLGQNITGEYIQWYPVKVKDTDNEGYLGDEFVSKITNITAGPYNAIAILENGTAYAWGYNYYGNLGTNIGGTHRPLPTKMIGVNNAIDAAIGTYSSAIVNKNTTALTVGYNNYGEGGVGHRSNYGLVQTVQKSANGGALKGVVDMGRGDHHGVYVTYELKETVEDIYNAFDNYVYSTGYAGEGITATNSTSSVNMYPVRATTDGTTPLTDIATVTAGHRTHAALSNTEDENVYVWGYNNVGQAGDGSVGRNKLLPVAVKKNNSGTEDLSEIMLLEAGPYSHHILAAAKSGGVYVWGNNNYYQLGDQTNENSAYPVVVGSSPIEIDKSTIRINLKDSGDHTAEVTASTTSQLFSLFDGALDSTSEISWKILNENIAKIVNVPDTTTTDGVTSTLAKIQGLKSGTTVIIATDSLTGKTVSARITVSEGFTNPKIAIGNDFAIALKSDGTIWGWGSNSYGKVGVGTGTPVIATPTVINQYLNPQNKELFVLNPETIIDIAVGADHALALDKDGQVYAWGLNNYGQLGINYYTYNYSNVPILVKSLAGIEVIKVAAGGDHTLALTSDGFVYGFGKNNRGQLNSGAVNGNQHQDPALMRGVNGNGTLSGIVDIAAGSEHSMMLLGNGTVWTVGDNTNKQLGIESSGDGNTYSATIKEVTVPEDEVVTALSAGVYNSAFITANGNAYAWSNNQYYQALDDNAGDTVTTPTKIVIDGEDSRVLDVQYGGSRSVSTHNALLTEDGELYLWGAGDRGQIGNDAQPEKQNIPFKVTVNGSNSDIWGVGVGGTNTSVILNDGYVYTWGSSDLGQIGDGTAGQSTATETNKLIPTKTGEDYISLDKYFVTLNAGDTASLTATYNKFFNVKENTDPSVSFTTQAINTSVANVSGMTISPVATGNTQVVVMGNGKQATVEVTVLADGYKTTPQVASGDGFTVALDKDGKVYTWGRNEAGQLGDGGNETRIIPNEITFDFADPTSMYITRIESGNAHTVALDNTGRVWAWGYNNYGQVGIGSRTNKNAPVRLTLPDDVVAVDIAVGETTSYALDSEGHIYAWGNTTYNNGYGLSPIKLDLFERMIQVSGKYGLKADGTIWQIPIKNASTVIIQKDTGDTHFVKVSSDDHIGDGSHENFDTTHTLLIDRNGNLYTFGDNRFGELGLGDDVDTVGNNDVALVSTVTDVVDIASGYRYSVAVTSSGEVYAWGNNSSYQAGQPLMKDYNLPALVEYPETAAKIIFTDAGIGHTVTIDEDGYVWSFGTNNYSQLGNQDNTNTYVPVIAGKMQISVKPQVVRIDKDASLDVTVGDVNNAPLEVTIADYLNLLGKTTSNDNAYTVESLDTSIVTVNADDGHTITGVKEGKAMLKVIKTSSGTIGYVTVYVGQNGGIYPMVDGGDGHSVALKADGSVWTWGNNASGQVNGTVGTTVILPAKVDIGENAVMVAAGAEHTLAIGVSGKVYSWGANDYGQLGNNNTDRTASAITAVQYKDGTEVEGAVGVSTHENTSYILLANGTVAAFGREYNDQNYATIIPGLSDVLQVSGNYALTVSGEVWSISYGSLPVKVMGYKNTYGEVAILKIAHGTDHLLALDKDGNVWAMGSNGRGQLGQGNVKNAQTPVRVLKGAQENEGTYLVNVTDISADRYTSAAVDANGNVYRWGANEYGQLGIGTTNDRYLPTKMLKSTEELKFDLVAGGSTHLMAVDENGNVWSAGNNAYSQLGDGTAIVKDIPVMAGGNEVVIYDNGNAVYGTLTMKVGDTKDLEAGFNVFNLYESDTMQMDEFEYVSSDLYVAAVEQTTGVVAATKPGVAYIQVTENNFSQKSAYIKVVVSENDLDFVPKAITKGNHSLALRADGTLWAWGVNAKGQLGTGNAANMDEPVNVTPTGVTFKDIAVGNEFSLAVAQDGTVWSTGSNSYSQLGVAGGTVRTAFEQIEGLSDIIAVAAGSAFGMALDKNGYVWTWGSNNRGQLGVGNIGTEFAVPRRVTSIDNVTAISAGYENAIMLRSNGTIWATGANGNGQAGVGVNISNIYVPTEVRGLEDIVAVDSGTYHSIALAFSSNVYTTGRNEFGQLGIAESSTNVYTKVMSDSAQVEAGEEYSAVITNDGKFYVFGRNSKGQHGMNDTVSRNTPIYNTVVAGLNAGDIELAGMSLGTEYTLLYTTDGDVYGFGDYSLGANLERNETKSLVPVLIGERTELISDYEITVRVGETEVLETYNCEKFNLITDYASSGSISFTSKNENIATVANVSDDGEITGVKVGTTHIVVTKGDLTSICMVHVIDEDAKTAPMISAGNAHVIALKSDGTVWAWGLNSNGQLGIGGVSNVYEPTNIKDLNGKNVIAIHAGEYHSIALTSDGDVYTWGANEHGQLGLNDASVFVAKPTKVNNLPEVVSISAGKEHTMLLDADGYVYSFGNNAVGQLGVPTTESISRSPVVAQGLNKVISISIGAGGNSTKAVRYDGTVWGWGENTANQIDHTNNPKYDYPVKIDLGEFNGHVVRTYDGLSHVAALLDNGRIITWGRNGEKQLGRADASDSGYNAPGYVDVFDGVDTYAVDIAVGALHNLAIDAEGNVWSWGSADQGRLGIADLTSSDDQITPQMVTVDDGTKDAIDIATGGASSYVVLEDGFVWSFGQNIHGQLGNSYAGEDPAYNEDNSVNAEDADKDTPVLVTGRDLKLKPESVRIYLGDLPYQMEVEFNRFNLITDDATLGNTYEWTITNELDKDNIPPIIVNTIVSVDADGKVNGRKLGTATLTVKDTKTGITETAFVEVVDPGEYHLEKVVFDLSVLDDTVLKTAIEKGYLDDDEYTVSTSEYGDTVYSLNGKLKSVYAGLVKTLDEKATTVTVRVKSRVNADVITMINKDGTPAMQEDGVTPITGKLLTAENLGNTDEQFIGYYEFENVPISNLEDNYYFSFINTTEANPYDAVFKAHTIRYSNDKSIKVLKIGEQDPDNPVDYSISENHITLRDAAVSDYVREAVQIGTTGNYYAVIKETGTPADRNIYIYGEVLKSGAIAIANKTVNGDHLEVEQHDAYYDVQMITMPASQNSIIVPIRVTAQNGDKEDHSLIIYRQSEATMIDSIEIQVKDEEGNVTKTYTAYVKNAADPQNYEVVIPAADIDMVDIVTSPLVTDVAVITYDPYSTVNTSRTAPAPGAFTYEDFMLDENEDFDKVNITLTADSLTGAPYTLTIYKVDDETDSFVSVDNSGSITPTLVSENGTDELMYIWSVADDATTANVTVTTALPNAHVRIGTGSAYIYTRTETVDVAFNEDGYMDIILNVIPESGATKPYTLRIYKESADARIDSVRVWEVKNGEAGDESKVEYDKENGKYVAKVKYATDYVKIEAIASQIGAKIALGDTEANASAASLLSMTNSITLNEYRLLGDVTTVYIAITPSDASYPQKIYQLDIVKQSQNVSVQIFFGDDTTPMSQNASGEYEYTLPASTDGLDNTTQLLKVQGVVYDGDGNPSVDETVKITISDDATFTMDDDATYTDEKEYTATQPDAKVVYVHVEAEDGTTATYKVLLTKLPETNGIEKVELTENKFATTYTSAVNTYKGQASYSTEGIVVYVHTSDARSQVAIGKNSVGDFVTPVPNDPDDPTKGGIARVVLTDILAESAGSTTGIIYIKRADGIIKTAEGVAIDGAMNTPKLTIEYASNDIKLYRVDSYPVDGDATSPNYTGQIKTMTNKEDGSTYYYLGIDAADIVADGTGNKIMIKAEANSTTAKVVVFAVDEALLEDDVQNATYIADKEVELKASLADAPIEYVIRVIAEDGVTSKDYKLILRKKSDNTEIEFAKAVNTTDEDPALYKDDEGNYYTYVEDNRTVLPIRIKALDDHATVAIESTYDPTYQLGSGSISYSTSNDYTVNVNITGADLKAGELIPVYVRSEDGTKTATYYVKVMSAEGNAELKKVEVVVNGVIREATQDADDPSKFTVKIPDSVSTVDVIATPQTPLVQYVHINTAYDSKDEQTGAVTRNNMSVVNTTTNIPVEVRAKDGTVKSYTLTVTKVAINTDLSFVKVNGDNVVETYGRYTYLKEGIAADETAAVMVQTADVNSSLKVEAITRDKSKSPYDLTYTLIGEEEPNIWTDDAVALHDQPVNRYRITVIAADGFTTKEYILVIRDNDDNADVEYIKVGNYYGVKGSGDVWTVEVPETMTFADITVQAGDELAKLTDIYDSTSDASDASTSYTGKAIQTVSDIDVDTDDDYKYIKVVSQDGTIEKVYTIKLVGTDSVPAVDSEDGVTVNGLAATAPTETESRYTFFNVLPDASMVVVGVNAASASHFVQIADGPITAGGYAELTVQMALTEEEMEVPFKLYQTADGSPAYENTLLLKRLDSTYRLYVKAENVGADDPDIKTRNLDGSYVYYIDGTVSETDVWALAADNNYIVEIKGLNNVSANNESDPPAGALLHTDLEDSINSNVTEVTIEVKSDDTSDTRVATYKLYIYKKSNNANIKSVTANAQSVDYANTDTTSDDTVNIETESE